MAHDKSTRAEALRATYPVFEYRRATAELVADGLRLQWEFSFSPNHTFHPITTITGVTEAQLAKVSDELLQWYAFQIGLVEMLSYWKAVASPRIQISAGNLSQEQITWWHKLLIKGMGEYFYVNQIPFTTPGFVTLTAPQSKDDAQKHQNTQQGIKPSSNRNILVGIGGGKDSAVSLGLLQKAAELDFGRLATFHINPTQAAEEITQISGVEHNVKIERQIDPLLLKLNQDGFLNGHTPFSAMTAFVSSLTAELLDFQYVVVSNERSSNEGNVMFQGEEINHQYSKTYEFESDFQNYLAKYAPHRSESSPFYFSFLRPVYELQIAQLFVQLPEYFSAFRSCNRGQKTNSWCGECPKCLFAFLILSPFLKPEQLVAIFGQNVFDKPELLPLALELMGYAAQKPLECVGTHNESIIAAHLSILQYQSLGQPLPKLLELLYKQVVSREPDLNQRTSALLDSWNSEHSLPPEFEGLLRAALAKGTQPNS